MGEDYENIMNDSTSYSAQLQCLSIKFSAKNKIKNFEFTHQDCLDSSSKSDV